jgi:hypothetical protein
MIRLVSASDSGFRHPIRKAFSQKQAFCGIDRKCNTDDRANVTVTIS